MTKYRPMAKARLARLAALVAGVAVLAGCVGPGAGSPQAQADAETVAACRQRADEVFNVTRRDEIFAPPPQVNTPFSANWQPGVPNRGLAQQFQRDRMVDDCIRNTGVEGDRTPQGAIATPASPGAPAAPR